MHQKPPWYFPLILHWVLLISGHWHIKHATLQYNLSKQLIQYNKITVRYADKPTPQHGPKHGKHAKHEKQKKLQPSADDPYPWLDSQDPRRDMTDEEIQRKYIDLSQSIPPMKVKKKN